MASSEQAEPPAQTRHSRHASSNSRPQAMPRRSTRGPLDIGGAAADALVADGGNASTSGVEKRPSPSPSPRPRPASRTPSSVAAAAPIPRIVEPAQTRFRFLLKPENFVPINPDDVPPAFNAGFTADGEIKPAGGAAPAQDDLSLLLSSGRFRAAAVLAASLLKSLWSSSDADASDYRRIFKLLYVRLASLQILGLESHAAQEALALGDLNEPKYRDQPSGTHLAPWELRVLVVRLQAAGYDDWRRCIMGYYELANEARAMHRQAATPGDKDVWRDRLADLGWRVGNALVQMGDYHGAVEHLRTLRADGRPAQYTQFRIALVLLKAGDVAAARECLASVSAGESGDEQVEGQDANTQSLPNADQMLAALCQMADGDYAGAAQTWSTLLHDSSSSPPSQSPYATLVAQNLAVCQVYAGRISDARKVLEALTHQKGDFSHGVTFNLATAYELCTERAGELKTALAARAAASGHEPGSGSGSEGGMAGVVWDKTNADFKL